MDKRTLSERDICTKFITPALRRAGWDEMLQIREEVGFTKGRIIVRGKLVTRGQAKRADYILYYKPNIPLTILVNPEITPTTDETFEGNEGCLSVPNLRGNVRRFTGVRVRAWDRHGKDLDFEMKGLSAGTFQHEVDHLDGVLFVDRADPRSLATGGA